MIAHGDKTVVVGLLPSRSKGKRFNSSFIGHILFAYQSSMDAESSDVV